MTMNDAIASLAARIDELEARLTQQDQSSLDMSDEVYRQQRQIAELERQLRHLNDRLKEIDVPRPHTDSIDETPPHY